MIGTDAFEKIFYLYTLNNPGYLSKVIPTFYENSQIAFLHEVTSKFYERFSQIPTKSQILALTKQDKFKSKISESIINIVFDEDLSQYEQEWLKETCESWVLWKTLDKSLVDTIEYVKTVNVNPNNVKDVINKVKTLVSERNSLSFNEDLGSDFFDYNDHIVRLEDKFSSHHNWVDNISGGYSKKTLVVYAGEPNVGKSIFLANDVVNFVRDGKNVSVISAEMSEVNYIKRIGCNILDVKIDEYETSARGDIIKKKINNITNGIIPPGKMFIKQVPTSSFSVPDIENYLLELETTKGMKLDVIVIDYINILANYRNPNSENTYVKIKQIAEDLRAMAIRHNWLIISATQFGKAGWNSTEVEMGDISESSGLSATADIIYGIIQTPDMHLDNTYWLKLLRIRDGGGKNRKCKYNILYEYMRLTETDEVMVSDIV